MKSGLEGERPVRTGDRQKRRNLTHIVDRHYIIERPRGLRTGLRTS
jgi:hypothetical protein